MATIGFIGLGNMGAPMAANLVKAGHGVTGYDIDPAALQALTAAGGKAAASASEAAKGADVVITMLPAGEHVREVWLHQGGLIEAVGDARKAKPLLIDCSTIDVDSARAVTAAAAAAGLAMLDAPVSGGTIGARNAHADFHGRRHRGGLRPRPADPGGDGQEHLPCRRPGRRPSGEDLQQHDAGHQHGRRLPKASCWRRSSASTGTSCTRSAPPPAPIPGRCRATALPPDRCPRRLPTATTRPVS